MRVVTGTAGSGGLVAFTTAFASQAVSGTVGTSGSTTLSTSTIPSHNHTFRTGTGGAGATSGTVPTGFNTAYSTVTTSATGGGELTLGGVLEPMPERELCCYLPSKTPHNTDLVTGSRERIMWIFGFCITDDDWQKLHEKH